MIKNYTLLLFLLSLSIISCKVSSINSNEPKVKNKILFVTTNIDEMNNMPNGTYLIELAIPFQEFSQKGYQVDIMSPNGGAIPIYHSGDTTQIVKSILQTDAYNRKTKNSLTPKQINPVEYIAVIIPGGYGQFWDTHQNEAIQQIIAAIYDTGGIIGTVGHGTATLIDVKLKSGEYLVKDKTMTSFPTWNEKNRMEQSNYGSLLPYDMETELIKRGANLKVYNHEKQINYEVVDTENRLVTASFASGGKFIAEEVLKLIDNVLTVNAPRKSMVNSTLKHPKLVKLWETDTILKDVESAIYDKKNEIIYVTNINGHWLKPNGKGFISKVNLVGKITHHKWIENIEGPTGTALHGDKLFVADFDTVLEIDVNKAKILKRHQVEGTQRINDLTVDEKGTIYGSGTKSGKLFALKNGEITILKEDLEWPNGVLYDNENILIGLGDKTIHRYSLIDKTTKVVATNISNPDGIIAIGNGDYLISSWEGLIHYVTKDGNKILLLDTTEEGVNAADICYIPSKKMLLVPAMLNNKLIAYTLEDEF